MDERTRREPGVDDPTASASPPAPTVVPTEGGAAPRRTRRSQAAVEGDQHPQTRSRRRPAKPAVDPAEKLPDPKATPNADASASGEPQPPARRRRPARTRSAPPSVAPSPAPPEPATSQLAPLPAEPAPARPATSQPAPAQSVSAQPESAEPVPAPVPAPVPSPAPEPVPPQGGAELWVPAPPQSTPARRHLRATPRPVAGEDRPAVRVPAARVALSTSSVYPESVAAAFEIARRLGYDGVELMVFTDPVSQDADAVRALSDYYGVPVLSVHSPCLLVTQRVWSTDAWVKLQRSQAAAERLGASTVVVHPPFRWQRDYARDFERGLARMRDETDVVFAVENMYPWRARTREWAAYAPDWDPRNQDYPQVTLDLSHTSVSATPALDMAADLGERLTHLHLADGSGLARDEHLIPGRGTQPCAEILESLASRGFDGTVVLEVSTRKSANRAEREAELAEALAFARLHLAAPLESSAS